MRRWLVIPSIAIHVGIIIIALFLGAWHLDRLDAGKQRHTISLQDPLPEQEGGHAAQKKQAPDPFKHKPIPNQLVVPPEHRPPQTEIPSVVASLEPGNGSGDGSGTGSNTGEGSGSGGPCVTDCAPKPEPAHVVVKQQIIAPNVMTSLWLSGERQIQPPDVVKTDMHRDGHDKSVASFQVCLDTRGNVASTRLLKSSGYAGYDSALVSGISAWKYQPYTIDGHGIPVCSVVTFVYAMK